MQIPVTVLLTQELTSLHVVLGLKSDQRPHLGLCIHGDLLTTSELPEGEVWVFYHCYLIPRKLLTQCLRMNCLTTKPCEMMWAATPELVKWSLASAMRHLLKSQGGLLERMLHIGPGQVFLLMPQPLAAVLLP